MHKAKLGQKQNKRTYKMGREYDSNMHSLPCGIVRCVSHIGQRGNVLAPRLQHIQALHYVSFVTRNGVEADGAYGLHGLQVGGGRCGVH